MQQEIGFVCRFHKVYIKIQTVSLALLAFAIDFLEPSVAYAISNWNIRNIQVAQPLAGNATIIVSLTWRRKRVCSTTQAC